MLIKKIKEFLPEQVKQRIQLLGTTSKDPNWMKYADGNRKRVFVFLAGFYQNLGDLAITYAQESFLKKNFPDVEIICVPSNRTYSSIKTIRTYVQPDDLITIIGGGNMDDMYVSLEEARLHVVRSFPNNKIISFPQTFAFSDTDFGRKRQRISRRVYSEHKDLTIFVREPFSLERIKKAFPEVKIGYCPDIVLSLNKSEPQYERHGVLCCFRSDKERSIQLEQREKLIQALHKAFGDISKRDTVDIASEECTEDRFEQTLEGFWEMLRHKEVVITDRLHCMIFCAITGTPCVVMDNINHKISGVYCAWLKDKISYIKYAETQNIEAIISLTRELHGTDYSCESYDYSKEFMPLRWALHEQ